MSIISDWAKSFDNSRGNSAMFSDVGAGVPEGDANSVAVSCKKHADDSLRMKVITTTKSASQAYAATSNDYISDNRFFEEQAKSLHDSQLKSDPDEAVVSRAADDKPAAPISNAGFYGGY
jgi:hypothetical protein